ncbi:formate/nitrite transporter family protein [Biformimicrobium ophioploci]|uniref:Formate transporter FocA n=1 Tax=Biformimicrobium ophioploci TaxID=3036711 RepID=A0ABQ6M0M5_9GAMM|nr:formate/nitrite transporter family protein [Microbulbifer sp. NKW57]GMG87900.1 formate transporter FocA [Microbulbifer sp. NKW57]
MSSPFDAYKPDQIAQLVENVGIAKSRLPALQTMTLAFLAGAFIAFGGMFYTLVITGSELGFGPTRLLGAIVFSTGLVLVIVAGAELFTGNNLIVVAWAERDVSTPRLLRNWILVFTGNFIGSVATAWFYSLSGATGLGAGELLSTIHGIAEGKVALDWQQAFFRGLLCNVLVCLAVWLTIAAHTVEGKITAIILPISAFVALGFEHSVANMYLIPVAMFTGSDITINQFLTNLIPVTLGNIVGGSVFVALVYWVCYLLPRHHD